MIMAPGRSLRSSTSEMPDLRANEKNSDRLREGRMILFNENIYRDINIFLLFSHNQGAG
jgi:hypothetical protein